MGETQYKILNGDCLEWLNNFYDRNISLSFIDPPFRQGKDYRFFDDNQPEERYWNWLKEILSKIYEITVQGGAVYFVQREKNTENVLRILREIGWTFQNLIIWKKKTSAVPSDIRFSKQYQIIAFATKGEKARVFNKLRIDLPIPPEYKYE
jgi:DNA modification methylase